MFQTGDLCLYADSVKHTSTSTPKLFLRNCWPYRQHRLTGLNLDLEHAPGQSAAIIFELGGETKISSGIRKGKNEAGATPPPAMKS